MRINEASDLTDNAWTERIGYLRQIVSDQYDPAIGATPREFVDHLIDNAEETFCIDDERILIRAASAARLDHLTDAIYNAVSGADNTDEIDATKGDIHDWLADGDLTGSETVEELTAEYVEYCQVAADAADE